MLGPSPPFNPKPAYLTTIYAKTLDDRHVDYDLQGVATATSRFALVSCPDHSLWIKWGKVWWLSRYFLVVLTQHIFLKTLVSQSRLLVIITRPCAAVRLEWWTCRQRWFLQESHLSVSEKFKTSCKIVCDEPRITTCWGSTTKKSLNTPFFLRSLGTRLTHPKMDRL